MEIVRQYPIRNIDENLIKNLNALIEIRDNTVHLINIDPEVNQAIHRAGTAAMLNLLRALQSWFGIDLNEYGFVPLPIGYFPPENIEAANVRPTRTPQSRILKYLQTLDTSQTTAPNAFNSTVNIKVSFTKSNERENIAVRVTKDPSAPEVRLTEEDFSLRFPFTYSRFLKQIKSRDESVRIGTREFHAKMKALELIDSCCWVRTLDPRNPRSTKRKFYSPQAVEIFFK